MLTLESDIRKLRQQLTSADEADAAESAANLRRRCESPTEETVRTFDSATNELLTTEIASTSSLRRTRLRPRKFRQLDSTSPDFEDGQDEVEELREDQH